MLEQGRPSAHQVDLAHAVCRSACLMPFIQKLWMMLIVRCCRRQPRRHQEHQQRCGRRRRRVGNLSREVWARLRDASSM